MLAKIQAFLRLGNVCQLMSNGSILAPDLTIAYKEIYALNTAPEKALLPLLFLPPCQKPTNKLENQTLDNSTEAWFWQTSQTVLSTRVEYSQTEEKDKFPSKIIHVGYVL